MDGADERSHLVEAALHQQQQQPSTASSTPDHSRRADNRSTASSGATSGLGGSIESGMAGASASASANGAAKPGGRVRSQAQPFTPPDGGWGWAVMVCSFLVNGIIFSIINCYGVIFVSLKEMYAAQGKEDSATRASIVGSLAIGFTFLLSPVSSVLSDKFGLRRTAFCGGLLAFAGMLCASFSLNNIGALCFTYGVMFGAGSSLVYTPSLAILGHYFKRHLGLANGLVASGSSIFTMAMPHILKGLIDIPAVGLDNTLRVLSGLAAVLMLASLSYKELLPPPEVEEGKRWWETIVNKDNWRNKKYVVWASVVPLALFGYFVPYVHIVEHVKNTMPEKDGAVLITCLSITSGLGRIAFGKIADIPKVNCIFLQQMSFFVIGTCTMLLTAAPEIKPDGFPALVVITLIMGVFDGCFITMFGPIAFQICGAAAAGQGIGFILGLCSVPLTVGPPVAGLLYDKMGNYTLAFLLAGCPPILGALLMFLIYRMPGGPPPRGSPSDEEQDDADGGHHRLLEQPDDGAANGRQDGLHPTATETTIVDSYDDAKPPDYEDAVKKA